MRTPRRILRFFAFLFAAIGLIFACGSDSSLREYLDVHFWLPFSKNVQHFERKNITRISAPFAGMIKAANETPLAKLRAAYQEISQPVPTPFDPAKLRQAIAAARSDSSLTARDREEVDLIDAKIDMRAGQPDQPELLQNAKKKLEAFLRTAHTPEFLSEARGWLARTHFLLGEQTDAGKIYLDELNRNGSNLSRETVLNSLKMTYGYDGGPELLAHLEDYFDTPEHAAFAIQLSTNPNWDGYGQRDGRLPKGDPLEAYARVNALLQKHSDLLKSESGANALALLGMRTALRMGDPPAALKIGEAVPTSAAIREEPDFLWMLASAHFLSRDYAGAEQPLLALFQSPRASEKQKAAAAYGLCGVYAKTKNTVEQIRFALWGPKADLNASQQNLDDPSVYWAASGFGRNLLLDEEAPLSALEDFLKRYPNLPDVRLVKYSLAVRLTRENRYDEAARIYESIHAIVRAPRLRQLAALYQEANRTDLPPQQLLEAKFTLAEFISANPNRIYFNDSLWYGFQRGALTAATDSRLTLEERQSLVSKERKLKDDQEEYWRAYLILHDIVQQAGKTDLGRKSAQLAVHCLRRISDRFDRQEEIRQADIALSAWLRQ